MMSCLMSKGARDNEDAQSFGYRYDDDLNTRRAVILVLHMTLTQFQALEENDCRI